MKLLESWRELMVPPDVVYFRDGDRRLVVNPEIAAWSLVDEFELDLLKAVSTKAPIPDDVRRAEIALARLVLNWLVYLPGRRPEVRQSAQRLEIVYYAITDGCNLRCPYCYASSEKCLPGELNTAQSLDLIGQAAEMGAEVVVFTGGEPMLRKDLFQVADRVRELGMQANIITNATLIRKPEIAARVADTFSTITISVDGGTEELHERTRGAGTFARTVNALRMLNELGVRPMVNHVVTDDNVHGLPDLAELFADIEVGQVRLMHHSDLGRGAGDDNSFEWSEYQRVHRFVWTDPRARNLLPDGPLACKPCTIRGNCGMGGTEIYVNSLGEVYPCKLVTGEQHLAGSLKERRLRELFDSERMADLRSNSVFDGDNLTDCRRCYIRASCGGGCRAYHMARTGDVKRNARSFCRVLRHQMVTSMWVSVGAGRDTLVDQGDDAFVPRLVSDGSVHPVYRDWETQQLPALPRPEPKRRLLPVVS